MFQNKIVLILKTCETYRRVDYNKLYLFSYYLYLACKKYLIKEFKTKGSYYKSKFSSKVEPNLNDGTLFERYLLVPVKDILETERWGYERYGVNSASRPLDFDLSVDLKKYEDIKNFNVVFFVKQHSG